MSFRAVACKFWDTKFKNGDPHISLSFDFVAQPTSYITSLGLAGQLEPLIMVLPCKMTEIAFQHCLKMVWLTRVTLFKTSSFSVNFDLAKKFLHSDRLLNSSNGDPIKRKSGNQKLTEIFGLVRIRIVTLSLIIIFWSFSLSCNATKIRLLNRRRLNSKNGYM